MEPTVENATGWAYFLQTQGGWGVSVILGVVLAIVIVILAKRYENHRNESEKLFQSMIKDQTELLTQNKIQNEQMLIVMAKVNEKTVTKMGSKMFAFLKKEPETIDPVEDETSLGNILKAMGAITNDNLEFIIKKQIKNPKEKIGELAVKSGFCTRDDLEYAIETQKRLRVHGANKIRVYAELHRNNINRSKKVYEKRRTLSEAIMLKVGQ